jgi:hypothetical protein
LPIAPRASSVVDVSSTPEAAGSGASSWANSANERKPTISRRVLNQSHIQPGAENKRFCSATRFVVFVHLPKLLIEIEDPTRSLLTDSLKAH